MKTQAERTASFFDLMCKIAVGYSQRLMEIQRLFLDRQRETMQRACDAARGAVPNPWTSWQSYMVDAFQRSILFWDTMRRRGNAFIEHERSGKPPVLIYDYEMILDGRHFERPVNYALVKIIPPRGIVTKDSKRPFIVVDPRAGHGPGIGGFKEESEIGVALRAGNPVYFVVFYPDPEPDQTLLDVCAAEARFVRAVAERHPESKKPVIYGNCQGGWAVMLLAASQPDITGPIVLNGAPMSYWGGDGARNPMRLAGGLLGGTWSALLASDLGNGKFDGANLVQNFESLDPANTFWKKYYQLYSNVDTEPERFLDFEKWWGGFYQLNENEIRWIVDNLFIGNKLGREELKACARRPFNIKSIKSPIIMFASMGDNITPPQQAFFWISDVYESTEEIKANGQVIVGLMHENIGHLGIFVSARVAKKEHSQIIRVLDYIQQLQPGLYVMKITESKDRDGHVEYEATFEEKRIEDLKTFARWDRRDEMAFEAVEEVSELNEKAYMLYARPLIRPMITENMANLGRLFHPLRTQRWAFSDFNPFLRALCGPASAVTEKRAAVEPGNPFVKAEKAGADLIAAALDCYRDLRDLHREVLFFEVYGGMISLGIVEPEIYQAMAMKADPRELPLIRKALATMEKGGYLQAATRISALIGRHSGEMPYERLLVSDEFIRTDKAFSKLSEEELRLIRAEQAVIVSLEPERALATLPALLAEPGAAARTKELIASMESLVANRPDLRPTEKEIAMLERIKRVVDSVPEKAAPAPRRPAARKKKAPVSVAKR